MSINLVGKRLLIDNFKKKLANELREKTKKKGVLTKIFTSNTKRSQTLVDILKDRTDQQPTSTDDDFLKKYNQMPKGGPKHSIAVTRAHHLTNFLSEYLINAFQSGHFCIPDFESDSSSIDSNGFLKEKYSFEICNVELPTDLTRLKIFWLASNDEKLNLKIENFLNKTLKKQIRSTLIDQRVMSYVPEVEFIRDNTKVLLDKLDEYLLKIKLEHDDSSTTSTSETTSPSDDSTTTIKRNEKKIDNIFGVNFTRLVESIKQNKDYIPWSNTSETNLDVNKPNELALLNDKNVMNNSQSKFEDKLKAFQINQRIKRERLSKSAILKLETQEYHESLHQSHSSRNNNY